MRDDLDRIATDVVRRLKDAGHEAYWVGGCVRNRLLGEPVKDYDVATSASPEAVRALFPNSDLVGAHFGVVLVVEGGASFEVATFRRDGRYVDHRRPVQVRFGTLEEDARRRDFTVNALFYDPIQDRLIDLVGGRRDLENRLLRAIGDPAARFEEDALRLMRAVRFAVRFQLALEPETEKALRQKAALIAAISAERARDELVLMMTGPRAGSALRMLSEFGLLGPLLPEVEAMRGVPQPEVFHPEGDVFEHTCLALDALEAPSPALAMATVLHDVGKPPTFRRAPDRIRFDLHTKVGAELAESICRRLKFPNRRRERIVALVARHMMFMDAARMKTSTLKRFMAAPTFDDDLALHRADALASHGDLRSLEFCLRQREQFLKEAARMVPEPLIDGDELIAMGHRPGPRFREMLDALADAQMEGEVRNRHEAVEWVTKRFPVEEGP